MKKASRFCTWLRRLPQADNERWKSCEWQNDTGKRPDQRLGAQRICFSPAGPRARKRQVYCSRASASMERNSGALGLCRTMPGQLRCGSYCRHPGRLIDISPCHIMPTNEFIAIEQCLLCGGQLVARESRREYRAIGEEARDEQEQISIFPNGRNSTWTTRCNHDVP